MNTVEPDHVKVLSILKLHTGLQDGSEAYVSMRSKVALLST